jgi:hypothetical protein
MWQYIDILFFCPPHAIGMGGVLSNGCPNPSIVYSSYMQQQRKVIKPANPSDPPVLGAVSTRSKPMGREAASWLQRAGVRTVIVGHQPVGDVPLVEKQKEGIYVSILLCHVVFFTGLMEFCRFGMSAIFVWRCSVFYFVLFFLKVIVSFIHLVFFVFVLQCCTDNKCRHVLCPPSAVAGV